MRSGTKSLVEGLKFLEALHNVSNNAACCVAKKKAEEV